jgi:hypothetical protein
MDSSDNEVENVLDSLLDFLGKDAWTRGMVTLEGEGKQKKILFHANIGFIMNLAKKIIPTIMDSHYALENVPIMIFLYAALYHLDKRGRASTCTNCSEPVSDQMLGSLCENCYAEVILRLLTDERMLALAKARKCPQCGGFLINAKRNDDFYKRCSCGYRSESIKIEVHNIIGGK